LHAKLCSIACALFEICSILAVFALHHAMRFRKSNTEAKYGGIAQLGERLHGMQEVNGSIPFTSTNRLGGCRQREVEKRRKNLDPIV
jgi:hypothetical protein